MSAKRAYTCTLKTAAFMASIAVPTLANAQVIVVQSTASKYQTGSKIDASVKVDVPEGKTIVVVLPSGVTRTINGPFNAPASRLAKSGGKFNVALFKAVENYIKTGGSTTSNIGTLRSALPRTSKEEIPFSWNTVHIGRSGNICLDKSSLVTLARSHSSSSSAIFTIVDLETTQKAQVVFSAGINGQPWPAELQLKSGSYGILTKGRQMDVVRLRLIESPEVENTLQMLHGQRCMQQLKAYLRVLTTKTVEVQEEPAEPAETE